MSGEVGVVGTALKCQNATSDSAQSDWEDITQALQEDCKNLPRGTLLTEDGFSMSQALSAVQLGEEQLDVLADANAWTTPERLLEDETIMPHRLSLPQIVAFQDSMFVEMAGLIDGHSAAHTIFASAYMHFVGAKEESLAKAMRFDSVEEARQDVGYLVVESTCSLALELARVIARVHTEADIYYDEDYDNNETWVQRKLLTVPKRDMTSRVLELCDKLQEQSELSTDLVEAVVLRLRAMLDLVSLHSVLDFVGAERLQIATADLMHRAYVKACAMSKSLELARSTFFCARSDTTDGGATDSDATDDAVSNRRTVMSITTHVDIDHKPVSLDSALTSPEELQHEQDGSWCLPPGYDRRLCRAATFVASPRRVDLRTRGGAYHFLKLHADFLACSMRKLQLWVHRGSDLFEWLLNSPATWEISDIKAAYDRLDLASARMSLTAPCVNYCHQSQHENPDTARMLRVFDMEHIDGAARGQVLRILLGPCHTPGRPLKSSASLASPLMTQQSLWASLVRLCPSLRAVVMHSWRAQLLNRFGSVVANMVRSQLMRPSRRAQFSAALFQEFALLQQAAHTFDVDVGRVVKECSRDATAQARPAIRAAASMHKVVVLLRGLVGMRDICANWQIVQLSSPMSPMDQAWYMAQLAFSVPEVFEAPSASENDLFPLVSRMLRSADSSKRNRKKMSEMARNVLKTQEQLLRAASTPRMSRIACYSDICQNLASGASDLCAAVAWFSLLSEDNKLRSYVPNNNEEGFVRFFGMFRQLLHASAKYDDMSTPTLASTDEPIARAVGSLATAQEKFRTASNLLQKMADDQGASLEAERAVMMSMYESPVSATRLRLLRRVAVHNAVVAAKLQRACSEPGFAVSKFVSKYSFDDVFADYHVNFDANANCSS